jgi:hypothetical protein
MIEETARYLGYAVRPGQVLVQFPDVGLVSAALVAGTYLPISGRGASVSSRRMRALRG